MAKLGGLEILDTEMFIEKLLKSRKRSELKHLLSCRIIRRDLVSSGERVREEHTNLFATALPSTE
jgi:hypothetical protein